MWRLSSLGSIGKQSGGFGRSNGKFWFTSSKFNVKLFFTFNLTLQKKSKKGSKVAEVKPGIGTNSTSDVSW